MIVLLLNDHVLKHAWPGFVTGKLSDVAGLVVAPPLVALLLLRRADFAATILTGALFTLVKTTETGAEVASLAWTTLAGPSRVLADPGDLLALPALALAWWVRRHSREEVAARLRVLTAVPLAVLAVTATAAYPGMPSADVVELRDGVIVLDGRYASEDGITWTSYVPPDSAESVTNIHARQGQRAACLRDHCYRLVRDRVKVMHSGDAGRTWAPEWEIPPERVTMLERELTGERRREDPIVSSSLVVQARPGGHVVVVANGRDGVAVRDVGGTWRRIGFTSEGDLLQSAAIPLDRPADDGAEMLVAGLAAAWAFLLGLAVQTVRSRRAWFAVVLGGGGALLMAPFPYGRASGLHMLTGESGLPPFFDVTGAVLLICAAIVAGSLVRKPGIEPHREPRETHVELPGTGLGAGTHVGERGADGGSRGGGKPPGADRASRGAGSRGAVNALALGVAVGLCVATPFKAWSVGWLDHGVALAVAVVAATSVCLGGAAVLRRRYLTGSSTSSPT